MNIELEASVKNIETTCVVIYTIEITSYCDVAVLTSMVILLQKHVLKADFIRNVLGPKVYTSYKILKILNWLDARHNDANV